MTDFLTYRLWPWLLKGSGQASVLIVLVLAVQWIGGRRFTPRFRHALWLLVMLRLALPSTISSPASLFNFLNWPTTPLTFRSVESTSEVATANPEEPAISDSTHASSKLDLTFSWLPWLWATVAFALALFLAITHWRLSRQITLCRPLTDSSVTNLLEDCKQQMDVHIPVSIVETAAVTGPCLFGFLRPRLLLPPGFTRRFSPDELRYVFLHELGHIKRHDIPLGWLMAWLQILHWFNPLVWLAFSRMRMDREQACDALVLSHVAAQENKLYGHTILKLLENFGDSLRMPGLAGIIEDKHQMKERISMIAKYHKTNRGLLLAALLLIALGWLTLTDAQSGDKPTPAASNDKSAPPKIVSTSPAIGAADVDPALMEITVTFDQDMSRGMSWTGGGPEFPETDKNKKAVWRNPRTCVLPVKLEAGHYYRVGINSSSFGNFRSAANLPASPSAIYFTTRGADEKLKARLLSPKVVSFTPTNGEQTVDPATTELRVAFNIPMAGGFSWCTVGDDDKDFPPVQEGKHPYWTKDQMTAVLPVALKPGMTYRINLNDPNFKNFQSAGGVPLEPVLYTFKTTTKP